MSARQMELLERIANALEARVRLDESAADLDDQVVDTFRDIATAIRQHTSYITNPETNNVATAIREQTEYFREEDQKEEDVESDVEDNPEQFMNYAKERLSRGSASFDEVRDAMNTVRRIQADDAFRIVPIWIQELMQETPHMFKRGPRRKFQLNPPEQCRLCDLKFGNPVHLITAASLPMGDDD